MTTKHEEADNIIVQQVLIASQNAGRISVIADDTDVFVLLLLYYYEKMALNITVTVEL